MTRPLPFGWLFGERPADRVVPRAPGERIPLVLVAGILAFLAVMSIALGLTGDRLIAEWDGPRAESATLQIIADGRSIEAEARAALDVLRATPAVRSVRVVELDEQRALLEPWLGTDIAIEDLPLPLLIDVTTDPAALDRGALNRALAEAAPHAVFDDHGTLRSELVAAARGVRLFGYAACGILALAFAAVHVLAARATVLGNGAVIRTLRLVGARDRFISGIFARRMVRLTLWATLAGTAAAAGLLSLLPATNISGFYLVAIGPTGTEWLPMAALPLAACLIAWMVSGATLRRMLRRWS